jgi:pimeloyl-ACP methyl ester carboxylesterase
MGLARMSVVGMRMGATLAAETFGSGPATIDDLVLWDPCASGRTFLREQGALWSISIGEHSSDNGSIESPGLVYEKDTVADLSALSIADREGPLADGVLLLMRSNRKGDRKMNERLALPHVERVSIVGQEKLVDVAPDAATMPEGTIETIVAWLVRRAAATPTVSIDVGTVGRACVTVGTAPDGVAIEERVVTLGQFGLFGIMTSRTDFGGEVDLPANGLIAEDTSGVWGKPPTACFLNAGVLDHVGPARLWVMLSRAWAEAGIRAVRFDLTGLGDSPLRIGQPDPVLFAPDALDDVLDALRDISPEDPSNAVLVGLCSGGYHAMEGAIELKVRGVCTVNPVLTFRPPEVGADVVFELRPTALGNRRPASGARKRWAKALPAHDLIGPVFERLPDSLWWIINRVAVQSPPARLLANVVDAHVNLFVIAGNEEARLLSRGEGRTLRRLWSNKLFHMEVIPGLEHSLFEQHGRELVTALLTEHVLGRYATPALTD